MTRPRPPGWIDTDPGGRSGTPLVLLHGFLGCARDWAHVIESLAGQRRCIAFDLPGHGAMPEAVPRGREAFRCTVEWIADRLAGAGIERCHLLGYSLGGRLAFGLVCWRSQMVERAIVVGASPGIEEESRRSERAARDEARAQRLERHGLADFLRDWYAQPLFSDLAAHEKFPEILERRVAGDNLALAATLRALSPGTQPALQRCLARSKRPLLLVAGGRDASYVASNRALASLCPSARAAVIEGSGHSVHLERPAALANLVTEFLDEPEAK